MPENRLAFSIHIISVTKHISRKTWETFGTLFLSLPTYVDTVIRKLVIAFHNTDL